MTRRLRQLLCRLLVGVLLFAQLAIASYACPVRMPATAPDEAIALADASSTGQPGKAMVDAAMTADSMADSCDGMAGGQDPDSPNLCAAHCEFGQQSDQTRTPALPAALPNSLYIAFPHLEAVGPTRSVAGSPRLFAATSPPHAILHCCFRI